MESIEMKDITTLIMPSNNPGALVGKWNLILALTLFFYGLRTKKKVRKCLLDYFPFSVFKRNTSMIFSNFLAISYIRLTDIRVEFRLLVFQKLLWRLFDDLQRPYFILDQKEESRVALENRCYGDIYSKAMPILVVIQQAKPYKGIRRDLYLVNF